MTGAEARRHVLEERLAGEAIVSLSKSASALLTSWSRSATVEHAFAAASPCWHLRGAQPAERGERQVKLFDLDL